MSDDAIRPWQEDDRELRAALDDAMREVFERFADRPATIVSWTLVYDAEVAMEQGPPRAWIGRTWAPGTRWPTAAGLLHEALNGEW